MRTCSPQIYTLNHCEMDMDARTNFATSFGLCMVFGGRLAKRSIATLGERGHTTFANWMSFVALGVWAQSRSAAGMFLGMLLLVPTMERRAALGAITTQHALAAGFGRGEFQGMFANWRALSTMFAPVLYGITYKYAAPRGNPGMPYWVAGIVCMLGELLHKSMSDKELFAHRK